MTTGAPIRVVGMGNVLMSDDGFGPCVVRTLDAGWEFPETVAVEDLGTPGLNLVPYMAGADALVVIDTVRADGPPGALRTYRRDELMRAPPRLRLGPHDPGLAEALMALELAGESPADVVLIGVVPKRVEQGTSLSPEIEAAVHGAVAGVLEELARLGAPGVRRAPPRPPDLWWQRIPAPAARD